MYNQSQRGFIPLIVALIAALTVGGGFAAYKVKKHNKEAASQRTEHTDSTDSTRKGGEESEKSSQASGTGILKVREGGSVSIGKHERGEDSESDDDENEHGGGTTTQTPSVTPPTTGGSTGTSTTGATYTLADIKLHNTKASCWTAVNGSVYNVTSWISQHPGGSGAIVGMCGIDASAAFNGQHGGQARPASELASFKIGVLK